MSAQSPSAYGYSILLHGAVAALIGFIAYLAAQNAPPPAATFELVMGAGNNYAATEAPALGVPGGIKIPQMPVPPPPPPDPAAAEPAPAPPSHAMAEVAPAPPVHAASDTVPNFAGVVQKTARHRAAVLEERYKKLQKKQQDDYEKFLKEHPAKKTATASATTKVSHVDAEGIRDGVTGGSTANKEGGADGKALSRQKADLLEAYEALLKERLVENFTEPSDTLGKLVYPRVEFYVAGDGAISGARILRSSGNGDFDAAVLDAFARTHSVGPRPDGHGGSMTVTFDPSEDDQPNPGEDTQR